MEKKGFVNMKFVVFLKATLGKMVGTKTLPNDFINLQFWQSWPHKFYNVKSYDSTKEDFERGNDHLYSPYSETEDDENDEEANQTACDEAANVYCQSHLK